MLQQPPESHPDGSEGSVVFRHGDQIVYRLYFVPAHSQPDARDVA
jgi:hypothetical protein